MNVNLLRLTALFNVLIIVMVIYEGRKAELTGKPPKIPLTVYPLLYALWFGLCLILKYWIGFS